MNFVEIKSVIFQLFSVQSSLEILGKKFESAN